MFLRQVASFPPSLIIRASSVITSGHKFSKSFTCVLKRSNLEGQCDHVCKSAWLKFRLFSIMKLGWHWLQQCVTMLIYVSFFVVTKQQISIVLTARHRKVSAALTLSHWWGWLLFSAHARKPKGTVILGAKCWLKTKIYNNRFQVCSTKFVF